MTGNGDPIFGIDLGTSFTLAGMFQGSEVDLVPVGERTNLLPSVVAVDDKNQIHIGEAALKAAAEGADCARTFKRTMGTDFSYRNASPLRYRSQAPPCHGETLPHSPWNASQLAQRTRRFCSMENGLNRWRIKGVFFAADPLILTGLWLGLAHGEALSEVANDHLGRKPLHPLAFLSDPNEELDEA